MNTRHLMLIAGLGLALAACNKPVDTPRPEFGEAVRNNMALQIINPEPPESMELPPSDGVRRALMMERYQSDEVEALDQTTTSGIQVAPAAGQ
jgi:type IV pilus biogenesis protein CpaD/CtpE